MTNNTQKSATECREAFEKLRPLKYHPEDDLPVCSAYAVFEAGWQAAHADTMRLVSALERISGDEFDGLPNAAQMMAGTTADEQQRYEHALANVLERMKMSEPYRDIWSNDFIVIDRLLKERVAQKPADLEAVQDDEFSNKLKAIDATKDYSSLRQFAGVLSQRLRQMDKRAKAANLRADKALAALGKPQASELTEEQAVKIMQAEGPLSRYTAENIYRALRAASGLAGEGK